MQEDALRPAGLKTFPRRGRGLQNLPSPWPAGSKTFPRRGRGLQNLPSVWPSLLENLPSAAPSSARTAMVTYENLRSGHMLYRYSLENLPCRAPRYLPPGRRICNYFFLVLISTLGPLLTNYSGLPAFSTYRPIFVGAPPRTPPPQPPLIHPSYTEHHLPLVLTCTNDKTHTRQQHDSRALALFTGTPRGRRRCKVTSPALTLA